MAFKSPSLPKATDVEIFINKADADDLKSLSVEQLTDRYVSINDQSQILKGRILLELRDRFKSNHEFGNYIEENLGTLCSDTRQSRTRMMNLARFFENRELKGISITAAYEISAPANKDIANDLYIYAKGKNLPVAEIKNQIALRKGTVDKHIEVDMSKKEEKIDTFEEKTKQEQIMEILAGLTGGEAKKLLRDCMHAVKW